jgi:sulfoxide reductase heme-binding subunit YedZ
LDLAFAVLAAFAFQRRRYFFTVSFVGPLKIPDRVLRWVIKPLVFVASLGPFAWLVWAALTGNLSANPLSDLTTETGVWTLRFICVTLTITPLRKVTGWNPVIKFRRMAGLFAFFYGTLHFLTYVIADRFAGLDFANGMFTLATVRNLAASVVADIYKRPFITVGFTAWTTMVPLAVTSTAGMIRRLGGRRWNLLHRLVYLTAMLGVLHYWWLVKADVRRPLTYGAVVAVLLGARVFWARRRAAVPARAARPAPAP